MDMNPAGDSRNNGGETAAATAASAAPAQPAAPAPSVTPYGAPIYSVKPVEPGKTLLNTASILMIVFGAWGFITAFTAINQANFGGGLTKDNLMALQWFELIASIALLAAGLFGVALLSRPGASRFLVVLGVFLLVLAAVDFVWGLVLQSDSVGSGVTGLGRWLAVRLVFDSVLPILFIVGAVQRGKPMRHRWE